MNEKMLSVRTEIDKIDQELLALLAKRRLQAQEMGKIKQELQLQVRDIAREEALIARLITQAEVLHLEPEFVKKIFQLIIADSVALQERIVMGVQAS